MGRKRYYANAKATTALAAAITNVQTTIAVGSKVGLPTRFPFVLTIDKTDSALAEAVLVTASPTSTEFTVTRGFDGTGNFAHAAAALVSHDHVAADYDDIQEWSGFHRAFLYGGRD